MYGDNYEVIQGNKLKRRMSIIPEKFKKINKFRNEEKQKEERANRRLDQDLTEWARGWGLETNEGPHQTHHSCLSTLGSRYAPF